MADVTTNVDTEITSNGAWIRLALYSDKYNYDFAICNLWYYQGRIKKERACNLGNIRIHMWAGECA